MRRLVVCAVVAACWTAFVLPPSAAAEGPSCGGRRATIVGTSGNDLLTGTAGADVVVAGAGDDTVRGLGGADRICGGRGADHLLGGTGADRLYGGWGRLAVTDEGSTERTGDRLEGGPGDDLLVPGVDLRAADDVIPDDLDYSRASSGVVVDLQARRARGAGTGEDTIVLRQALAVTGSAHADRLSGSARRDLLIGGAGSDLLRGRDGHDRLYLDPSGARRPGRRRRPGRTGR